MADVLPDLLPADALGQLASLRSLLDLIDLTGATREDLDAPPRRHYTGTLRPADLADLSFDPTTLRFAARKNDGTGSSVADGGDPDSWLAFPDPTITYDLTIETDATHTDATGPFDLLFTLPSAVLTLPGLRGAKLDAQGMLVEDLDHPKVRFHLPRLSIRTKRTTGDVSTELVSANAGAGAAADEVSEFCRMEPNHALIGPGNAVGFTFRTAVLDLSESTNPPGNAKSLPLAWQGLWLPEARIYIAPSGLEDLAVSAGVEDLWIGIGRHKGVTGLFELDVVNRGHAPAIRVRFHDEDGRWIGTEGVAPALTAELPESTTIVVDASGGIAPFVTTIAVDGAETIATRATVTTPAAGNVSITVTVTDAGNHSSTLTVTASHKPTPPEPIPGSGPRDVTVTHGSGVNRIRRTGGDELGIDLELAEATGTVLWTWDGGGSQSGPTARVPVADGATVNVTATRTVVTGAPRTFTSFFFFDHPEANEDGPPDDRHFQYSDDPAHTHTTKAKAADDNTWIGGVALDDSPDWAIIAALPAGTAVSITGFASYDKKDSADAVEYNQELSKRRGESLKHLMLQANPGLTIGAVSFDGFTTSKTDQASGRPKYWRAVASFTQPVTTTETTTAVLHRDVPTGPVVPVTNPDPEPDPPAFPDWFHRVGLKLQLDRGDVVLAEINGEIDIRTAAERSLAGNDPTATLPPAPNPNDGISQFLVRLDLDKVKAAWQVTAAFKAVDADTDGLWKLTRPNGGGAGTRAVNTLGALAALGPVLAAVAPESPSAGEYVPLAVTAGAATGLAIADVIKTKHVILHGGELVVGHTPQGSDVTLLLDLETAIGFDAGVVKVDLAKPITTRYKAIGLKLGDRDGAPFQVRPMFDASRGYTLDIPNGAVVASGPLGDILKIFGAKVSKDNPTYIEVDVGVGAELGIVTIDRAKVRLRLDQPPFELPTLTALGATIDVPGAFRGSGYVEVTPTGLAGFFDLEVAPPVGIRAAAALKVERKDGVLGVFVSLELELPAPIPLGSSGLGIYGFAAGVGINMTRTNATPALDWLERQPGHNPLHPQGWGAQAGAWAFAAGITLGTVDGGFILKMKGLLVLELPGPRVLIVLRARVLQPPIDDDYPLLAAIDISPDSITIGLLANYDFAGLVSIRVPVQAFFDFDPLENWSVDLGTIQDPVSVKVLEFFQGSGYLMVHGLGINPPPPAFPDAATSGITLAVGFHVQFVWGNTDIGLYIKVAGGFDALISIDPLFVGGKISISGELRLFIISIGASAELTATTDGEHYSVHGEVCGKVEFFFFDIEGCVDFRINDDVKPPPVPPPLVEGVSLVSRSPALVEGSGTDGPIDGVLAAAKQAGTTAPDPEPVPLDAVPVVEFGVTPVVSSAPPPNEFKVLGAAPKSQPGTPANPWVQRGAYWWRYELRSVTLSPVPAPGPTPCAWWTRATTVDPQEGSRLALLSWVPNATPKAVPYGERLTTWVYDRWGGTCSPVAVAAPALFTFDRQPVGESTDGWDLTGIYWPDDPGTVRSDRDTARLQVTERWRCGDDEADRRRGIDPADVMGGSVRCATQDPTRPERRDLAAGSSGPDGVSQLLSADGLVEATALLASGLAVRDLATVALSENRFRRIDRGPCTARLLRSPQGDTTEPTRFGNDLDRKLIEQAWERTRFEPGDLLDAVLFHTGETPFLRVLFAASEQGFYGGLLFRFLAADGSVLAEVPAKDVAEIGWEHLPDTWWNVAGPWRDPVERTAEFLAYVTNRSKMFVAVASLKPPPGTVTVAMGLRPDALERPGADPFLVGALEVLLRCEQVRQDHDLHLQGQDQDALTTVLTQDLDDHALLAPGQEYTVAVEWQAFYVDGSARPGNTDTGTAAGPNPTTQRFTFTTQNTAQAPRRLDPWVLDTNPGNTEGAAFCDDPVRVTFATQKVADLFDAYGYRLALALHGSSGRHPNVAAPPTTGSPPGKHLLVPGVNGNAGIRVDSPFVQAVRELALELPCIPPGSKSEHDSVVLPYELDPETNYLIDIVREPKAGGADEIVFRHEFTTSRFRSLSAFAGSVRNVVAEHRAVPFPAPFAALPEQPSGPALDQAFMDAGLDAFGVPRYPRIVVLWSTEATPQPVAVVIDANEALWRSRVAPQLVTTPPNPQDPSAAHWALRPIEWLTVTTGGTAAVRARVRGPGGQRAVIALQPGQRGRSLAVTLVRAADPVSGTGAESVALAAVTFDRAPWEDDG